MKSSTIWKGAEGALSRNQIPELEGFGSTHGANERQILADLPAKMESLGVDAVISGMGC